MSKFNLGNANVQQKQAILTTEGPLLIIAGPGTGKSFTLVKRVVYLIVEKGINPNNIILATFTEKAAKEIITRISNELFELKVNININEMYIGTFHSICLRLLKDNLEFTRLKKNYRIIDEFEQQYMIFQNIKKFREIENYELLFNKNIGAWKQSAILANYINIIQEELVDINSLFIDKDKKIIALANTVKLYIKILDEENIIDFSSIQVEALKLIQNNLEILESISKKIQYIMIDEYQDTNYVQEQFIFLINGDKDNICVVGDDDQGLYRFRGATIRNILEFPNKFKKNNCKQIKLTINYRSDKNIVDFCNKWMENTSGRGYNFKWDKFRFNKKIISSKPYSVNSNSVIKVSGKFYDDDWFKEVLSFINKLKNSNKIDDYNQIAFLFRSVKNERVINLANFLEDNGINVYSPRSNQFFDREEIKLILGILILIFPNYLKKLNNDSFEFMDENLREYYIKCVKQTYEFIQINSNKNLLNWIQNKIKIHTNIKKNTDYGFSGIIYQIFRFEPFKSYLNINLNKGIVDTRPVYNLSTLSSIIARYEYLHGLNVFTNLNIETQTEKFFNMYLKFLYSGGIGEFEHDSEYAPSGCVSFLTIHQSKGMEFPIVLVGSLNQRPKEDFDEILNILQRKYYNRDIFEPQELVKYFDFWRLYYTAFSRAQNLLILTCNEKSSGRWVEPGRCFEKLYKEIPYYDDIKFNLSEFNFEKVKNINIKNRYAFTSHISLFENCSLQYKFYKELGFTPVRIGATLFGTLVHQTIEDVHRAALRKDYESINNNLELWFNNNYNSLVKKERAYLGEGQKEAALNQIRAYIESQNGEWSKIQNVEVEVSFVKENYILEGKIDLIKGTGDTIEIVDFKSEKKPDFLKETEKEKIDRYRRQLEVYSYIIEERTGKKVSKLNLYYTSELSGVPVLSFLNNKGTIDATIKEFDNIVEKIERKEFIKKSTSDKLCSNCDMRFYCNKQNRRLKNE